MTEFFHLTTYNVMAVYGLASIFGVCVYLMLSRYHAKATRTKERIYLATTLEFVCLAIMYTVTALNYIPTAYVLPLYLTAFAFHHAITPYILFNLDKLFEDYTHIEDRGKGRGIYLTVWNTPFVVVPIMLTTLTTSTLPITYVVSFCLLIPFLILISSYIQNPTDETEIPMTNSATLEHVGVRQKLARFWADKLDRKAFITQSTLHLYYGVTGVMLPIYLYNRFGFEWDHIGMLLAAILIPFILVQIPFGRIEDRQHNEKQLFFWGVVITLIFTVAATFVSPDLGSGNAFLLLLSTLFISRIGCSLIEIATETLFYKHVTQRDEFALLMFRAGRLIPYALGSIFIFF
jgi:MFS family permease